MELKLAFKDLSAVFTAMLTAVFTAMLTAVLTVLTFLYLTNFNKY